jgi:hypothetical protein
LIFIFRFIFNRQRFFHHASKGSTVALAAGLFFAVILQACQHEVAEVVPETPVDSGELPPIEMLPKNPCSDLVVDGYTDKTSYYPGDKIKVFLSFKPGELMCRLDIYTSTGSIAFSVPASVLVQAVQTDQPYRNGFGYEVSAEFTVPDVKSGVYLIEQKIPVIIKTHRYIDVLVVYPSNTANAYCEAGGKSLYSAIDQPNEVSFQRPIPVQNLSAVCLNWFSTLDDFSIGYICDQDLDDPSSFANTNLICIVGHNEYWTRQARQNFDQFVNQGGNALILSGNTMWWQVRYSDDGSKLICYRDENEDPIHDPLLKTVTWDKAALQYPILSSIGVDFNHGGYGLRSDAGWDGYKITNDTSPLLENTGLLQGNLVRIPSLEYDGAPLKGFDSNGDPVLDLEKLGFYKGEIVGYDKGFRVKETIATFCIFQPRVNSGIIINTATTDWCSANGMGGIDGDRIKRITRNAIYRLLHDEAVFSF